MRDDSKVFTLVEIGIIERRAARMALEDAALAMQAMNDDSGDAGDWVRALAAGFLRQRAAGLHS